MTTKAQIRKMIWDKLEREDIAAFPRPCYGRIPNFVGNERATRRLLELEDFRKANCVFCAPDHALRAARDLVLAQGKVLAAATPHMKSFVELRGRVNTSIRGLIKHGRPLRTKVDLIVQGSVAVDLKGNRLGKGKGYGDKEIAYLKEKGLAEPDVKVVTIIHDAQIVEDLSSLMTEEDVPVDYILTPTRCISVNRLE
jgi:5-formyltetrahydrofolate cyclo-ligase